MAIRDLRNGQLGDQGKDKEAAEEHAGHDDACRCKETSRMSPKELLRLMMSDLAFWKKIRKG